VLLKNYLVESGWVKFSPPPQHTHTNEPAVISSDSN